MSASANTSGETPIDRLTRAGIQALSDAELVSLLINADAPKTSLLLRDGLPAFARASWTGTKQPVTRRQAARIIASLELSRRLASVTDERHPVSVPR